MSDGLSYFLFSLSAWHLRCQCFTSDIQLLAGHSTVIPFKAQLFSSSPQTTIQITSSAILRVAALQNVVFWHFWAPPQSDPTGIIECQSSHKDGFLSSISIPFLRVTATRQSRQTNIYPTQVDAQQLLYDVIYMQIYNTGNTLIRFHYSRADVHFSL